MQRKFLSISASKYSWVWSGKLDTGEEVYFADLYDEYQIALQNLQNGKSGKNKLLF